MSATLLLTTMTVLLAQSPQPKEEPAKPKPSILDDAPKLVNNIDESNRDKVVDRFIQYDIGHLKGPDAAKAYADFQKLDVRALPSLSRGIVRASNIQASCPILVLASKMRTLLSETEDPKVLTECSKTLGKLGSSSYHAQTVAVVRREVSERLTRLEKGETEALRSRDALLRTLAAGSTETLKEALKDEKAEMRWAAVRVIGSKQLHCAEELISVLDDANEEVRRAAHQVLVTLSRGRDYGPDSELTPEEAMPLWRNWLRADRDRQELLKAPAEKQAELLTKLAASKGLVYTDALAMSIQDLSASLQDKAREALTERLAHMTATTLTDKLADANHEVRRAAAVACAMKEEKKLVPELIRLLDDAELSVVRAAHSALKDLTKQDFGPDKPAVRYERTAAVKQWREWWAKQGK